MGDPSAYRRPRLPHRDGVIGGRATGRMAPLLNALPPEHLVDLIQASHGVKGRRGERIAGRGDDAVTLILHGVAAAHTPTVDGEHVIHALHGPGDPHGLTVVLGHTEAGQELVSVEPVDALVLPGRGLRDLIDQVPGVAAACLRLLAAEHAALRVENATFAASSAAYRVEHRILELGERFGVADAGRTLITLPLTQESIAAWARTSRESTAKVLHDLRRAGIVTTGRRQLVIEDLPALRRRHDGPPDRTVAAMLREIG